VFYNIDDDLILISIFLFFYLFFGKGAPQIGLTAGRFCCLSQHFVDDLVLAV
jgi:hypothetical protein